MKNKILQNFLVSIRAIWWLLVGPQKRKLAKLWATYKYGGIKLCWYRAVQVFAIRSASYELCQNQLSRSNSNYLLNQCFNKPLFSIIVPVYNVECKWLAKCITSVLNQYYKKWELILVDDASSGNNLRQFIKSWSSKDDRIKAYFLNENHGIAGATNFGIRNASGDFIGFLDHDDELTPDALTWITWSLKHYPEALWLYSDEDLITTKGKCHSPRFKPDFSSEYLLSNMFTCHFSVYKAEKLAEVGFLRYGFDGSQDHDLAIRLSEIIPNEKIIHIPRVLYHWREISSSATMGVNAKPKAPFAGRRAVAESLERRGITGEVSFYKLCPTVYKIKLEPAYFPKVSIIIPTKNALSLIKRCINSIRQHTNYPNYEIIIVNNCSDDPDFLRYIEKEKFYGKFRVISYNKPFNHSEMNNIAVASINSDFAVLMNNDIEVISDDWLKQLVATVQLDKSIGVVGPMLLYPNGTVQHAGMILGVYGVAAHAHQFMHHKQPGYCGRLQCLQEYSSLTGALMLVRCSAFNQVGGFDIKQYPTVCNDVDLCLRFKEIGFRCIYNPMVKATHLESKTRGISSDELFYKQKFQSQYSNILKRDCFYNPNFALDSAPFRCYRCFPISEQVTELSKFFEMK